mgnify:FL=1
MDTIEKFPDVYASDCPTRQVLDLIADKWSTLIINLLKPGPLRFANMQRQIRGISQKMLTQALRELERDGLVKRTVYAQVPPRVEYELTALGQTLVELITPIIQWSEKYITAIQAAQETYDRQNASLAS